MVVDKKPTGRASSMPGGLAIGAAISLVVTILLAAMLAKLIEGQTIAEENMGYGVMVILLAASFLGAMASYGKIKRQRVIVCLLSGALYFGILLSITALFFGGQYEAVGVTGLLVLCGSGAAALLGLHGNSKGRRRKIKVGHR